MEPMTAAEALCRALAREGVEVVFGHPGGAILPFYDALYRAGRPRHVLMRHEQGAAHAADGYARATGRVGVCLATSGPGATNLATGLATAAMDSVPLVAITGQVPSGVIGTEAFQETDILGITMPITKHGFLVEDADALPGIVAEAFRIARSGRPGPVLIDIPKDVQTAPCVAGATAMAPRPRPRPGLGTPAAAELDHAARLLNAAERPVVLAGRGVILSGTEGMLRQLAERADLPVSTTLLGLEAFPASDPRALGLPGMHGTERANRGIQAADLILGLGLRFDDRVTGVVSRFAPGARIVHIDIDPVSVGRTVQPEVRLIGDLRVVLPQLLARAERARRPDWWSVLRGWARQAEPGYVEPGPTEPLTGRGAIRALARRIDRTGGVVVTDVGQHQMWLAQELGDAAPRTHLTSGGLGTMGYALPAGFGAAVGLRGARSVWVISGDGGFQMTLQELATVVQERVSLRIAVVNNGFLGMVRQWQELFYDRRYAASELSGPDFVRLAEAYGIAARAVADMGSVADAVAWADDVAGPALLDLRVLREENVYPIVPSGAALDQLVSGPASEEALT